MNRHDYRRCENCTAFAPVGDRGECHRGPPSAGPQTWPPVHPLGWCDAGFVLNPASLFDEIDRQAAEIVRLELRLLTHEPPAETADTPPETPAAT